MLLQHLNVWINGFVVLEQVAINGTGFIKEKSERMAIVAQKEAI